MKAATIFHQSKSNNMKKIVNHILPSQTLKTFYCMFILLAVIGITSHAQPPDVGGDVDGVPIDGGLSLLVAAGVGYGMKKVKEKKQKES